MTFSQDEQQDMIARERIFIKDDGESVTRPSNKIFQPGCPYPSLGILVDEVA